MHALLDALLDAGASFPGRPGTPWPTATHTVVHTVTGARYEFREHGARVYITVRGSSSGYNPTNVVLARLPEVLVGERLRLEDEYGPLLTSSAVTGWERTDLLTGFTSTSAD